MRVAPNNVITSSLNYLEKHRFCEQQLTAAVAADTDCIVVIPCYNEPDLLSTLKSLASCDETQHTVEIIVVINAGEQADENVLTQNEKTFADFNEWITQNTSPGRRFYGINIKNLPAKHAGVGLARKIGMDEAVSRFAQINNPQGVIVCLDADCTVAKNYLTAIENHFAKHPATTGCSVYFEHPLTGNEFSKKNHEGIINYELFLRYYIRALHYCGFPYSFHTIGSSMAVRSSVYQKQGGMNRRKAGEDFYFLHKIFPLGNFTELHATCVYPSPRESDRVPFGTGSAIKKYMNNEPEVYTTYNVRTFIELKLFFETVPALFTSPPHHLVPSIQSFLEANDFQKKLEELRKHSASEKTFVKRFFYWFDGFMVLKFVHYARDHFYPNQPVADAAIALLKQSSKEIADSISLEQLLVVYREWERSGC